TIGADSEVPDLAAVGIGAAPDTAVLPDGAADSGGEGHVEERGAALSGAEFRLSDGAHVGIVIHDGGDAGGFPHEAAQTEAAPPADVSRKYAPLLGEVTRPAETDAAALQRELPPPLAGDFRDLRHHPRASAARIGGARFAAHDCGALEH